ncbi:DUF6531 domain-containing protein [Catenuloplanes japonicus]|uniref:DUF6531 domain-containing protein n=1 Tax=Catenuloplanes japonicus TaxID=33876 RepID=UPI000691A8FE|nr:DUF6531 domain-containing protein [Catenuloplanes japonicus]
MARPRGPHGGDGGDGGDGSSSPRRRGSGGGRAESIAGGQRLARAEADVGRAPAGSSGPGAGRNRPGGRQPGRGEDANPAGEARNDPDGYGRETDRNTTAGDPVDVVTGRVIMTETDVELPGVLPLVLRRTHQSVYAAGRAFGHSWASTLDVRLEIDAHGVLFVAQDGMILIYPGVPAGDLPVHPATGPRWPLTAEPGALVVTDPQNGTRWRFRAGDGRLPLSEIVHAGGDRIVADAGNDGLIRALTHSGGYRVEVGWAEDRVTALSVGGQVVARYRYDQDRQVSAHVNGSGRAMRYTYDNDGRLARWTDRNAHSYGYRYDARGRCVSSDGSAGFLATRFAYDDEARTTTVTDALGHDTVYAYDARYRIVRVTDARGGTTLREWDDDGRLVAESSPAGRRTRMAYDARGNLVEVVSPDGATATAEYGPDGLITALTGADGATRRFGYDERGRRSTVTDVLGGTTRYGYDGAGHLASVTDPAGTTVRVVSDGAGLPVRIGGVTYDRDAAGRVIRVTEADGAVTTTTYTRDGQPASRTRPDGSVETWRYDAEGNLREHTGPAGAVTRLEYTGFDLLAARTDPDGARITFAYDAQLRLTEVRNPLGQTWRYAYDPGGNLVSETDFDGRTVTYGYDLDGRLIARDDLRVERDAGGRVTSRIRPDGRADYTYDAAGRLLTAESGTARLARSYDAAGRLLSETADGRTITFTYDAAGRRLTRTTPSGVVSQWRYADGPLPVGLTVDGRELAFTHDAAGRQIESVLGANTLRTAHDPAGRIIARTLWAGTDLVTHAGYAYRPDGLVTAIADETGATRAMSLDRAGRIVGVATAETWTERYAYDVTGNVTSADWEDPEDDARGDREYAGTRVLRAGRYRYEHDAAGRVILRQRARHSEKPATWHYTWNSEDRLAGVRTPDGTIWSYRYDPMGRRTAKYRLAEDGSVAEQTDFVWDGNRTAEEIHHGPAGSTATTWEYQPGTYTPIVQTARHWLAGASQTEIDRRFHLIVANLAGAPTHLVTPDGEVAWRMTSTIWGTTTSVSTDGADCRLRLAGQYHDPETGHHYNHQRYYDPATARYLSRDPLGLAPSPNPVAYVGNPTVEIDPLGLAKADCIDNRPFTSRAEAEAAIFERAGIDPDTEPDLSWEVGDDRDRRGTDGYRYSDDPGGHGYYRQYETDNGSRVIVEHTNDPNAASPHFHAGRPKSSADETGVDFGWSGRPFEPGGAQRYRQLDGKHHYFYPSGD